MWLCQKFCETVVLANQAAIAVEKTRPYVIVKKVIL
jgi:hypothetical protein